MTDKPDAGLARMVSLVHDWPAQLRAGAALPGLAAVQPLARPPRQIVFCGMGGSAMSGALLPLLWPGSPRPWFVHRDEGLPPWVDADTLVIASSYSGETAETLAAVATARARGCPLAALTCGGRLASRAAENGGFPVVTLPAGQPPRTALGFSFAGLLHLLHRLGLGQDPTVALLAAAAHLEAHRDDPDVAPIAAGLAGRFVMIYTAGDEAHAAGLRLKAQLNENAKLPAAVAQFPELTHNDVVGWRLTPRQRDAFALLVLRGGDETPAGRKRVGITLDLVREEFASVQEVYAAGATALERVLGLIYWGDRLSVALAREAGVDPMPIVRIDALKRRMVEE